MVHVARMPTVDMANNYIVVACSASDSYRDMEYLGDIASRRVMADMVEDLPA